MTAIRASWTRLLMMMGLILSVAACATSAPSPDASLVEVKSKPMDHLWVKPGVDFSSYHSVLLDEATVAYREEAYRFWREPKKELRKRLDSSAKDIAKQFNKTFERRTSEEKRYKVASQKGAGVLQLTPALIDVYIINPDEMLATTSKKVISRTAGDMTLKMEVRDSVSGELIAVFEDYQDADSWIGPQRQDNISLMRETRIIVSRWAGRLSDGLLDKASIK